MRRFLLVSALLILGIAAGYGQRRGAGDEFEAPSLAKNDQEKRILAKLGQMRAAGEVHLEVPVTDGRMLRLIAEAIGAKNVLEIGTSTGYSGLWLSLALQKTGGKLTTFEIDPGRAAQARRHFREAGVDHIVTLVEGDAHQKIREYKDPVDLVFIDADKGGYLDYLNQVLPLVRPGGVILAHNVGMVRDYVDAVNSNPDLETLYYMNGSGLAITLKKR
ncbi:MAG TPA: O-methyltransferase [Acidobacteriota bacterium]|nr:O-methyltransferase [Acidobacteriota bacterium]